MTDTELRLRMKIYMITELDHVGIPTEDEVEDLIVLGIEHFGDRLELESRMMDWS